MYDVTIRKLPIHNSLGVPLVAFSGSCSQANELCAPPQRSASRYLPSNTTATRRVVESPQMPRLQVRQLDMDYVYRDVTMVNVAHRKDQQGETIKEGQVCLVRVGGRTCFAVLRGYQPSKEPQIHMDEYTRDEKLHVKEEEFYEFEFRPVGLFGQLCWAWNATEMGYQVSSRLAVLGFVMGVLGLLLSIVGLVNLGDFLWRWFCFLMRLM